MSITQPPIGGTMSRQQIAKLLNTSIRGMERAGLVIRYGIPSLATYVEEGRLNLLKAEKIARLPHDQQPAAIQDALNSKPRKRSAWELQHDVDRLAGEINRMARRWTEEDRGLMTGVLHDLARQLADHGSAVGQ